MSQVGLSLNALGSDFFPTIMIELQCSESQCFENKLKWKRTRNTLERNWIGGLLVVLKYVRNNPNVKIYFVWA
jgi:hypothetical protein